MRGYHNGRLRLLPHPQLGRPALLRITREHLMHRRHLLHLAAGLAAPSLRRPVTGAQEQPPAIPALLPRDPTGRHFLLYSDCCSGVPGTAVSANLAAVNRMVARIDPSPEFIAFPGDAVRGYTEDYGELRRQWDYWLGTEMAWVAQRKLPLFQSTSNHNTYDAGSETVFRAVHAKLPRNGPPGQEGLAYWVRSGNLLYVSTHQPDQQMLIDHAWLERVLENNADATYKFVAGHYPVFPVNGYQTWPLWCFPPRQRRPFWDLLVKHRVDAYLASHIIAFDVQLHGGLPQIVSGGAGTAFGPGGFMPGRSEFFHAVQIAVDQQGLRYQVHDPSGRIRERWQWPMTLPDQDSWQQVTPQNATRLLAGADLQGRPIAVRIRGRDSGMRPASPDQTLLAGVDTREGLEPVWIGIERDSGRLLVRLIPVSGEGWQVWRGPPLPVTGGWDHQLCLDPFMGPGGVLHRAIPSGPWSTLESTSSKGCEHLAQPQRWVVGHGQSGPSDRPFRGGALQLTMATPARLPS